MPDSVIRIAGPADGPALAALRRAWTAENGDSASQEDSAARERAAADEGFEARFADWYQRESARRITNRAGFATGDDYLVRPGPSLA